MKIKYRIYLVTVDEYHAFFRYRILEINNEKIAFYDDLDKRYPNTDFEIDVNVEAMKMCEYLTIAVDIGWQMIEYIYTYMHSDCAFYTLSYTIEIMKKFKPNYTHLE